LLLRGGQIAAETSGILTSCSVLRFCSV
jgi:hypothetical protein